MQTDGAPMREGSAPVCLSLLNVRHSECMSTILHANEYQGQGAGRWIELVLGDLPALPARDDALPVVLHLHLGRMLADVAHVACAHQHADITV